MASPREGDESFMPAADEGMEIDNDQLSVRQKNAYVALAS
jgi:hypothetical protein